MGRYTCCVAYDGARYETAGYAGRPYRVAETTPMNRKAIRSWNVIEYDEASHSSRLRK
jgi:hypothetical protein